MFGLPPLMNYSLFRSRTFWTLVFMFVVNGYAAVSGQVPGNIDLVINAVLSLLASYFHLQTGQSTSGTN